MRTLLGLVLGLAVRLWALTWRRRVVHAPELASPRGPRVYAFWHGRQMGLIRAADRPLTVMVSWSKDGALQAAVMRVLGVSVVRGSSSRGGARGLRGLLHSLAHGSDVAFAVDGPRGPARRPKPGAARAAELSGAELVPLGSAASRSWHATGSWDDFEVPLPFARVVVVAGEPVPAREADLDPELLARAIAAAELRALAIAMGAP
jgi:lysophospholipid acyltransferase (LPLAT)-like uncharacterized protein